MGWLRQAIAVILIAYLLNKIPSLLQPKQEPRSDGFFKPEFKPVAEAFRRNIELGLEQGASVAFYHKGELVVDLWGGFADYEAGRYWKKDTISQVYSVTKGVTALVVAMFVERGLLDYNKLVSEYWPEFGSNGKENITLDILIRHKGGLAASNGTIPLSWMLSEPEKVDKFVERQKPSWPPGTRTGYHGITYGIYLDPLLSKVDPGHRNIHDIMKDDVAIPFDIDFYNGLPYFEMHRVARQGQLSFLKMTWDYLLSLKIRYFKLIYALFKPDGVIQQITMSGIDPSPAPVPYNNPDNMRVPMSSYNGFSNGRSLAKLFGIVANGGSDKGKTLLSRTSISNLNKSTVNVDSVYGLLSNMGHGIMSFDTGKGNMVLGTIGAGGQIAYADLQNQVGFGYVTNHPGSFFNDDPKVFEYQRLFYECLEKYVKNKS